MAINSQCKNPLSSWDGKLMNYQVKCLGNMVSVSDMFQQVWTSTFTNRRPEMFVKQNIDNSSYDRRLTDFVTNGSDFVRELSDYPIKPTLQHLHPRNRPVILWGSHHKTGTYLAQKIFSLLCSKMNWCCLFMQTRDSIISVKGMMSIENADVVGHSQWVWDPEELGVPYKFIHFYRKPLKKVISGYRYHMEGAEPWTTRPLHYDALCSSSVVEQSEKYTKLVAHYVGAGISHSLAHTKAIEHLLLKRSQVIEHCRGAYLCESCCRREHEADKAISFVDSAMESAWRKFMHKQRKCEGGVSISSGGSDHSGSGNGEHDSKKMDDLMCSSHRISALRRASEYNFICKTLGKVNGSLMDALLTSDLSIGLAVEASLDFYENLRMARIYNRTFYDPNSLNIDLDHFMGNFATTTRLILKHLDLGLSGRDIEALVKEIGFFDISTSSIYRWSMSNPFVNHINNNRNVVSQNFDYVIRSNEELMQMYRPILTLMP